MGTFRLLLLVCLCLPASVSAQQAQNDRFKVEGTVINSVTGKPLPRVLVQISGRSMLTGPEGEFSFAGIPAGLDQIVLTKPGYFTPGATLRVRWLRGGFEIGPDTGKITMKLAPEAVISGQVTGQDDEPLDGATIEAIALTWAEGRQVLTPASRGVRTDEDGNFRIAGLPSGKYYLAMKAGSVTRRVLGAQTPKSQEAYPAVIYYPGVPDLAAATAVDLVPGQRMDAPFSLLLAPAYKVAGKVVAPGEWKQIQSLMIVDALGNMLFRPDQFDVASGAFEFRTLPAGTYAVRVAGRDRQDRERSSIHKMVVTGSVANFQLALHLGVNIPVVTHAEFSKPPPQRSCEWTASDGEAHNSDCSDYPAARVELIAIDTMNVQFSTEYGPMGDPSALAVYGVAPGKYMVRAQASLGGYVQSVRSGSLDLLHDVLTVPEEGVVAPIEVAVRDDSGALKVMVRAEKPGQFAAIVAFRDDVLFPSPRLMGGTSVELNLPPLAPGNYKIFAFDSIDGLDYGNPEFLAKYASKAASVTVTANGNASVMVDLVHTGE